MIDRWLLPNPARLVARLAEALLDGHQLVLCSAGPLPGGFRRAVEEMLRSCHVCVCLILDETGVPPLSLLRRAMSDGLAMVQDIPPGIYWIDGVVATRAEAWAEAAAALAEAERNRAPLDRAQLVLPLPQGTKMPRAVGLETHSVQVLRRVDLEVAARYRLAAGDGDSPLWRVRVALAIELAVLGLPNFAAIEILERWLKGPDPALSDVGRLAAHAAANGLQLPASGRLAVALCRAQQSALLGAIEDERLRIVETAPAWCRVPHTQAARDGRPEKCVRDVHLLEITHLYEMARSAGLRRSDPVRARLELLRDVRNALSHLDLLSATELFALLQT